MVDKHHISVYIETIIDERSSLMQKFSIENRYYEIISMHIIMDCSFCIS